MKPFRNQGFDPSWKVLEQGQAHQRVARLSREKTPDPGSARGVVLVTMALQSAGNYGTRFQKDRIQLSSIRSQKGTRNIENGTTKGFLGALIFSSSSEDNGTTVNLLIQARASNSKSYGITTFSMRVHGESEWKTRLVLETCLYYKIYGMPHY